MITKVLIERLKKVMHKLVDRQQMAFIKNRHIMVHYWWQTSVQTEEKRTNKQGFYINWTFKKQLITQSGTLNEYVAGDGFWFKVPPVDLTVY